jgi:hypothetical protein
MRPPCITKPRREPSVSLPDQGRHHPPRCWQRPTAHHRHLVPPTHPALAPSAPAFPAVLPPFVVSSKRPRPSHPCLRSTAPLRADIGVAPGVQRVNENRSDQGTAPITKAFTFYVRTCRRSKNGVNQWTASRAYREDIDKNDQGWVFLVGDSIPLRPDKDGPAITAVAALVAGKDDGTYKTPSK